MLRKPFNKLFKSLLFSAAIIIGVNLLFLPACSKDGKSDNNDSNSVIGQNTEDYFSTFSNPQGEVNSLIIAANVYTNQLKPFKFLEKRLKDTQFAHPHEVENVDKLARIEYLKALPNPVLKVSLEYSDDRIAGQATQKIADDVPVLAEGVFYQWDTTHVPAGIYSVHLLYQDGGETKRLISSGSVSVLHEALIPAVYYGGVDQIFQTQCVECHQPQGGGSPSFYDYETIKANSGLIKYYIRNSGRSLHVGYMPPFFAADTGQKFKSYRELSEREIRSIEAWVAADTPAGNSANAYPAQVYSTSSPSGKLVEFQLAQPFEPYKLQDDGKDLYQCFVFNPQFTETTYVTGSQVAPQNTNIVHHVLSYAVPPELLLEMNNALNAEPDEGYRCFSGPLPASGAGSNIQVQQIGGWAPGNASKISDPNRGIKVAAGSWIVTQFHYHTPTDPKGKDHSKIRFWTTNTKPNLEIMVIPIANLGIKIPAFDSYHEEFITFGARNEFPVTIHALTPHAHQLGKELSFSIRRKNGSVENLVHLPIWRFDWQTTYELKTPVTFAKGDQLNVRCVYDNSAKNPNQFNNPPEPISWGDATTDEMCIVYLTLSAQPNKITSALARAKEENAPAISSQANFISNSPQVEPSAKSLLDVIVGEELASSMWQTSQWMAYLPQQSHVPGMALKNGKQANLCGLRPE